MAVTLQNADKALQSYYLDAVSEQLNNQINPFFAMIEKNSEDVYGKDVRKIIKYGVNGGIGAGTEDGELPKAGANSYAQFVSSLKNLYGVIEISDKAVKASGNNAGAFVNLLNSEMESLIQSSKFNFGRMLFGDGSGKLCEVHDILEEENAIIVSTVAGLMEGMLVDVYDEEDQPSIEFTCAKIATIDRTNRKITFASSESVVNLALPSMIYLHDSKNKEITGLKAIFDLERESLYGLKRSENPWMNPYVKLGTGSIKEITIQKTLDEIEARSGSVPNIIICSWGVRRAIQKALSSANTKLGMMELQGGYKAMSYNGIPIIADRFVENNTMYFLNTNDFVLNQLCDWQWLTGDDGSVLKQVAGKPVYTATLVKYAELMCTRPHAQGMLGGVSEE